MEHIAIDLGSRESQICIRSETGVLLEERRVRTDALGELLKSRPPSRVVLETSAESFRVADAAREAGHDVRVVAATLVRSLGVGSRGVKNDRRDAQILSEVSTRVELGSVHIPSKRARQRKALCTSRDALVSARTQLVNSVRGWLRTQGGARPRRGCDTFARRLREQGTVLPEHIVRVLNVIDGLNSEIQAADDELGQMAKGDEVCRRLMTVPGVGPVTAVRFVAAVDEVKRFGDSHRLESYFGMVPGEDSSSERRRRTSLTKAGSPKVRTLLVQAAWSAWRSRPDDPMVRWARRVAERRGKKVAITALARKLAGILHAIWRDSTVYDPSRGADHIDPDGVVHSARPR
jgi:transposase